MTTVPFWAPPFGPESTNSIGALSMSAPTSVPEVAVSSTTMSPPATAVGASLTGFTVNVKVWVSVLPPSSVIVAVMLAEPNASAFGVAVTVRVPPVPTTAKLDGSKSVVFEDAKLTWMSSSAVPTSENENEKV